MNDYALGANLRRQILSDLERGLPLDGRRLQALVGDFCGQSQLALLPALKYLVLSPGFSSAASQQPPLPADARLQLRLQQELNEVFAGPICARMDAVLRGLLSLQEANAPAQNEPPLEEEVAEEYDDAYEEDLEPAAAGGSSNGLVAVLSFMAGVLVVGVGGGLAWLLLQTTLPSTNTADTQRPRLPGELTTPSPDTATAEAPAAPDLSQQGSNDAAAAQAITSVEQLYNDLSLGNIQAARQRFSGEAADQFDPAFFRQFQRVSVDQLRTIGINGSDVNLEGVVTFVYPDGTSQSESRQFT
ncbi:MAG: hypothetical protein RLZZ247_1789, partial [Cyanobacteriota bacterium]